MSVMLVTIAQQQLVFPILQMAPQEISALPVVTAQKAAQLQYLVLMVRFCLRANWYTIMAENPDLKYLLHLSEMASYSGNGYFSGEITSKNVSSPLLIWVDSDMTEFVSFLLD